MNIVWLLFLSGSFLLAEPSTEFQNAAKMINGDGVPKNTELGVKTLKKLSNSHDPDATFLLGLLYFKGEGVEKDQSKAYALYEQAAAEGSAKAKHLLSLIYRFGCRGEIDLKKAEQFKKEALSKASSADREFMESLEKTASRPTICEPPTKLAADPQEVKLKPYKDYKFKGWDVENRAGCPKERSQKSHPNFVDPKIYDLENYCQCYLANIKSIDMSSTAAFALAEKISSACSKESKLNSH